MDENSWLRDKLFEHAADIGAQKERQRAQAEDVQGLRQEVRDGLASLKAEMIQSYAHLRGEIVSLRDEERRRADDLIDRLEQSSERSRGLNRALLFGVGVLIVFGQQVVEHLPQILELLGP